MCLDKYTDEKFQQTKDFCIRQDTILKRYSVLPPEETFMNLAGVVLTYTAVSFFKARGLTMKAD